MKKIQLLLFAHIRTCYNGKRSHHLKMPFIHLDTITHAVLRIDSAIGSDPDEYGYERGMTAAWFLDSLSYVDLAGKLITLEVNSYGGNLKDAQSMYHSIKSAKGSTIAHVIGVAASSASYLIMGAGKVVMNEDAQLMIHKISSGISGTADEMRKAADAIDKMNESVATVYAGKSGLSTEKVLEMMAVETWMTAFEALELGFCDEVIGFDGSVYTKDTAKTKATMDKALTLYMQFQNKLNISPKMTAEEQKKYDEAVAAQKEAQDKLTKLENEKKDLEAQLAAETDMKIEAMVDEAVASGKIVAEMKDSYKVFAKHDFAGTKNVLDKMDGRVKLADLTNKGTGTKTDDRKDWDFSKWSKEDEDGLRQMKAKQPDQYKKLLDSIK